MLRVDLSENRRPSEPTITSLSLTIWDALEHLLVDVKLGRKIVNVQLEWEICFFQHLISNGDLSFLNHCKSGLEVQPRLAALVELAIACGFGLYCAPKGVHLIEMGRCLTLVV
jgi:hypothetical protein